MLGGRWKPILLFAFWEGAQRFSELRRQIPQIGSRILARQLREMERDGLIKRCEDPDRPRTCIYALTPMAAPLGEVLVPLRDWGARYIRHRLQTAELPAEPRRVSR